MFGLYSVAGFPALSELSGVQKWFWLGLTIPAVSIIGEVLNRKIGSAAAFSQWVHHIWSGISVVALAAVGILLIMINGIGATYTNYPPTFWWFSVLSGIAILSFVFTRQRAYMAG